MNFAILQSIYTYTDISIPDKEGALGRGTNISWIATLCSQIFKALFPLCWWRLWREDLILF